jgi:hypothetical protein
MSSLLDEESQCYYAAIRMLMPLAILAVIDLRTGRGGRRRWGWGRWFWFVVLTLIIFVAGVRSHG